MLVSLHVDTDYPVTVATNPDGTTTVTVMDQVDYGDLADANQKDAIIKACRELTDALGADISIVPEFADDEDGGDTE